LPAAALTTKSIEGGLTANDVAANVAGAGATITNVKITGSPKSIGTFAEGTLGVTSGIILSSGDIATAVGPNNSSGAGTGLGTDGDVQLDAIVKTNTTHDAAILEFDVVTKTPVFMIHYVFASEEYREYVDKPYNDVFAFFVDGANIALTPGTSDPVAINSINHLRNTQYYRDNENGTGTQFDGYTVPMIAFGFVEKGVTHHIKIAIADTADAILDSAVFIEQGGITGASAPIIVPDQSVVEGTLNQALDIALPIYYVFSDVPYTLSISGIPGATATFSDVYTGADGRQYVNMHLVLGPETPPGAQTLTIHSVTEDASSTASIVIVTDCKPPTILGLSQPQTANVPRGTNATFNVTPSGSGPFTYQWYSGFTGMTFSPVADGTLPTYRTGPVNDPQTYWVRIRNACGSTDSLTAFAFPQ
jgi:hypothetical protein